MPIDYGNYNVTTSGNITANSGIFNNLLVNGTGVSASGHTHTSSDITNFNSSVSGLVSGIYAPLTGTLNQFASTTSAQLASVISNETGSGILVFNNTPTFSGIVTVTDGSFSTIINPTGIISPTGSFTTSLNSANLTVTGQAILSAQTGNTIAAFDNIKSIVSLSTGTYPSLTELSYVKGVTSAIQTQLDGKSATGHTHSASQITDFNEAVDDRIGSGLFVAGTGINLNYNDSGNSFTISVTGLISNPSDNRILTSRDSTTTGIDAESHLTFDGTRFKVGNNTLVGNYSTIAGGLGNTCNSDYSLIGGGQVHNIASGANYSNILAGAANNIVSSTASLCSILGGGLSTIQAGAGTSSTIIGGFSNIIGSGVTYGVIGGGASNTITNSSSYSFIGCGQSNTVSSGNYATIPGGYQAKATRYGENSHAAGYFAAVGDAQHTTLIARKTTTDATANQVLFLDNSSARLTLPAKTTWTFSIKLSAYNDTDSAAAGWIYRGVIKRDGSNNTSLVGSIIEENWKDSAMSSASSSVVADDSNEALEIRVTGLASKNIRWVAVVDLSQVSYGTP